MLNITITDDTVIRLSDRHEDRDGHLLQGAAIIGAAITERAL